ncbi:hypothetical protein GGTG_12922 [Gaeumannomyces tritici R3-111a-1]|uniref:Zinc ribbon domain-containing protein n=1 Tax=Gaeumannomyces tritici (strain R3-111a-1) TaxID=644352 RepID=J3PHE3_GAET3|nr:hypothetical protein GGTG_12922 [Gaeumannomyces tritici R3-111a-1]EJT69303.1 hypothetical protein GGTG_12922 [Gaeumannomyces tritici R3-111a-1]
MHGSSCPKCGAASGDGSKTCGSCGAQRGRAKAGAAEEISITWGRGESAEAKAPPPTWANLGNRSRLNRGTIKMRGPSYLTD